MGNQVAMSEALMVTVVSMIVVFVVLVMISALIGLLKNMGEGKKEKLVEAPKEKIETTILVSDNIQTEIEDEDEIIAVISAAIAASLGLKIPDINITSIRRTNQSTTAWREMSKQEHLYGKL